MMLDDVPEGPAGRTQRFGNRFEIAGNPPSRRPAANNRRLDLLGRALEEVPHSEDGQLLFARRKRIEGSFRAIELGSELIHREVAKSLR